MKCSIEWCTRKKYANNVCRQHVVHLSKYGECRRFGKEPNEIIDCGTHYEIILYDIHLKPNGHRAKISKQSLDEVKNFRFYYTHGYAKIAK